MHDVAAFLNALAWEPPGAFIAPPPGPEEP